jgi:hypothetical protein
MISTGTGVLSAVTTLALAPYFCEKVWCLLCLLASFHACSLAGVV